MFPQSHVWHRARLRECSGLDGLASLFLHAELNTYSGLLDGYVTLVAEYTWHLWLFTLSPHASPETRIGQMARDRILSSASSLQITFGKKLSLCNNTISVTRLHTAGSCLTLWINHTSEELVWEQYNFTVGGCDSHPPVLLHPPPPFPINLG